MGIFGEVVYYMFGGASACAHWVSSGLARSSSNPSSYMTRSSLETHHETSRFNPANGLPMIGGVAGTDILSNPYGTDNLHAGAIDGFHDPIGIDSGFDSGIHDPFDSFSGIGSGIDDHFGSGCGMDNW